MATIDGTAKQDTLVGSAEGDAIRGFGGSDFLDGGAGDDVLQGDGVGVLDDNGSFETYAGGTNVNGSIETPNVPGWTLLQGSAFELVNSQNKIAADGLLSLDMEASSGNLRIAQTVPELVDGANYTLNFQYSRSDDPGSVGLEVSWGGVVVGTIDDADVTEDWQTFSIVVVEGDGDGSNALTFRETGAVDGSGTYLDDVRLIGQSAGSDTLLGGDGNDVLAGGYGPDVYDGGSGFNVVQFGTGVTLDLADPANNTGEAVGDGFANIAVYQGSSAVDVMRGDAGNNRLWGASGTDTLVGNDGDDELYGQNGSDSLEGGNGNDRLLGGSGLDTLRGGAGDDFMDGGTGADLFDGGAGLDRVDYRLAAAGVRVDLANATGSTNTGDALNDRFISIEELYGSNFSDTLLGTSGQDIFAGAGGDDSLVGLGGNDAFYGDQGNDTILGGAGSDVLKGDTGDDSLDGGSDEDTLLGGENADTLNGGAGEFRDLLDGGDGDDVLEAGAGLDDYTGGLGADLLIWRAATDGGVWGDRVFGFVSGEDRIGLDDAGFAGLAAGVALVDGASFVSGAAPVAAGAGATVLYDTSTGILSFDANGTAAGGITWIAELQGRPTLAASDFTIL